MLSDVGGAESILVTGFAFILGIWNYNNFDNYMVAHLFTYSADKTKKDSQKYFKPPKLKNIKDYCVELFFCCCKKRIGKCREELALEKARNAL